MLSDTRVKTAKPAEKIYKLYDENGLYLEVPPTGKKRWRFRFSWQGKERRISLGVYPDISLKQACDRCQEARAQVANGVAPGGTRKSVAPAEHALKDVAEAWITAKKTSWWDTHLKTINQRLSAYNKEMGSLIDGPAGQGGVDPSSEYHKAAVLAADMAVKAVNPDFNPSSRSAFLRDRGVVRLLNMFSSAVVLFAQRRAYNYEALKQAWHRAGKDNAARLSAVGSYARYEAYDFLLPAVAMGLLQSLAGGSDDPDKWGKNVRSAYLDSFAMRLPVAGGVISGLITNETWRGMSTVFEQPVRMGQWLAGAMHQGNEEKMVGAMADALSFLTKIPVSRVVRSGMRGYDQWQRGEGTPLSLVMPSAGK